MKRKNEAEKQQKETLSLVGNLNFAFCPVSILKNKDDSFDFLEKNFILSPNKSFINKRNIKNVGFFYICYSIALDQTHEDNGDSKDYFYFQVFAQHGLKQAAGLPIFGLFSSEEIVSLIKEIDTTFEPEFHDKQIFGDYQDAVGTCSLILKLMQNWTTIKLMDFKNLYLQQSSALKVKKQKNKKTAVPKKTTKKQ